MFTMHRTDRMHLMQRFVRWLFPAPKAHQQMLRETQQKICESECEAAELSNRLNNVRLSVRTHVPLRDIEGRK